MNTRLTKYSLIALALIAMLAGTATADTLHDQIEMEADWQQGFVNTYAAGGPMGTVVFGMSDVSVVGGSWVIESISIVKQVLGEGPTSAYINIFPKTGSLPGVDDVPGTDMLVTTTWELIPDSNAMAMITASGLNIVLEPGEYWIGLAGIESPFFWGTHAPAAVLMGDFQASYDPWGGWANLYREWDATILIEGTQGVVATDEMTMGGLKALYR